MSWKDKANFDWKLKSENLLREFYFANVYNDTIIEHNGKGSYIGWRLYVDKTSGEFTLTCVSALIDAVKSLDIAIIENYISKFDRLHDYERKMFEREQEKLNESKTN